MTHRLDIFADISSTIVTPDLLSKFVQKSLYNAADLWLFRKQFTSQLATATFMTYCMHIGHRMPHLLTFSRTTGHILASDLFPGTRARLFLCL